MASSAVSKGRLGHSWLLAPWRPPCLVWPCGSVVSGTWARDLPVCPTIHGPGSLGAGGIALGSGVPGFLLVNRLVCKPACYLGPSLFEPYKKSLSLQHPLYSKVQGMALVLTRVPRDWRPFSLWCAAQLSLVTGMLSKGGSLRQGQWGKESSQPELSCHCDWFQPKSMKS